MKPLSLNIFTFCCLLTASSMPLQATASPSGGMLNPPGRPAPATTLAELGRDPAEFPGYVVQLRQRARAAGIAPDAIERGFSGIHFVDHAVKQDRNQPEKKLLLDGYLARVMSPASVQNAREALQRYQNQLLPVANRFGVPAPYLVALWSMESRLGAIQGREEVVSALATLAFEGRREAFFTDELIAALKIIDRQQMSASELKGSWAGAMGQNQFMPSSLLRYGADGDGDGKIDIWNNVDDVFASSANYLAQQGWDAAQGWGQQVTLPAGFERQRAGLADGQAQTPAEWQREGVTLSRPADHQAARAWIILPDDGEERAFMVYDNFRAIMHWNRSYYFALSIGLLADAIQQPAPEMTGAN